MAGNSTSEQLNITPFSGPTITSFSPASAAEGTLITLTGTNFSLNGLNPEVMLGQQGGGTINAPISSFTAGSLSFVIPSGATTGPITTVDGQSATSSSALTVVSSSSFTVTAGPSAVTLLPGQSTTVQVSLASTNGLTHLASLNVAGLPSCISANFQPPQITAGQFSILTLSAPASQIPKCVVAGGERYCDSTGRALDPNSRRFTECSTTQRERDIWRTSRGYGPPMTRRLSASPSALREGITTELKRDVLAQRPRTLPVTSY